jgi:carbon catabolite-derepressing protein kinase
MSGSFNTLPLAIKILKNFKLTDFLREIMILKLFKHPYVPYLYGLIDEEKSISLINELINGDTLDTFLIKYKPSDLQIVIHLLDLATVLTYLHSLRLIHRDLKPGNVMIDNDLNLKLLDFGISKMSMKSNTTTLTTGTILYMAPENFEVYNGQTEAEFNKSKFSTKVDVWAFGCMVSEILSQHKPWAPAVNQDCVIIGLLYAKKNFFIPPSITDEKWVNFIKECTIVDPKYRINMKQVRERLLNILYEKLAENDEINWLFRDLPDKHSNMYFIFRICTPKKT